jgi:putative transcriptional regulator
MSMSGSFHMSIAKGVIVTLPTALSDLPYFTGKLLLALPAIGDPRFDHAIIAIVSHDADGAMGVAIGQAGDFTVSEILDQADLAGAIAPDPWVLIGGPVEPQRGFVVHSRDWGGQGTIDVAGQFAVSGSLDVLRAISTGKGPARWLLAMGYAGWGPGQLEGEISADAWHVTDLDENILFERAPEARWRATMARDGIDPARIAVRGGRA